MGKHKTLKGNKTPSLKWESSFKKVNKVCVVALIVLVYLLSIFVALYQELNIYVMESNVVSAKCADSIVQDTNAMAGTVLAGVEHFEVKAPKGTGNFVALFNEEGSSVVSEIWVVQEMSVWESIKCVLPFTLLDLLTFCITLNIIKRYFEKYKWRICALSAYQIIFIMFAWLIHSYAWNVLFGGVFIYVSGSYTIARLLILSIVMANYDKSTSITGKKNHLGK